MRAALWLIPAAILCLSFFGSGGSERHTVTAEPLWAPPTFAEVDAALSECSFDEFVDSSYRLYLLRFPQRVTDLGMAATLGVRNNLLDSYAADYVAETARIERLILARLQGFDRQSLSPDQQLTYDVYQWAWDDCVRGQEFADLDYLVTHYYITSRDWLLYDLLTVTHPLLTVWDVEDYLARLSLVSVQFGQLIAGLDARATSGIIAPRIVLSQAVAGLRGLAQSSASRHPFYTRLADGLSSVSNLTLADREQFLSDAEKLIEEIVLPATRRLRDKLSDLLRIAPDDLGYGQQPNGNAYYEYALQHQNQTNRLATEIHDLGLQQVARLRTEIENEAAALDYPANLSIPEIFNRVSREGGLLHGVAILEEYERLLDEAKTRAADVFEHMPTTPIAIVGDAFGGYYRAAPADGSRPAEFVAPIRGSQPRYTMPTLTYHETIPGHHMQIATAGELDLPLLRTVETFLGYAEGWALYAERLAWDLGWYEGDPYGNLGRLSDEMMRAVRLVVDTGIHTMGWSFDEAVDYFVDNTGRPTAFAQGEILRYTVWPGQSTAYMVGFLTMLDLRDRVREALGEAFNLAAYHTMILENGSLPLAILEQQVDRFIERTLSP